MKIGFIGLGIMGKPMAKNLLKVGHQLIVNDLVEESVAEVVACGAVHGKTTAEITKNCEVVITMLPNSPHVKGVVLGEGGILENASEGLIIVDNSSIDPSASREMYEACKAKGVHYIDCPVSGGEPKAIDGSLAIMVGGDKEIFEKVKDDILLKMGATAVYCGGSGAGNITKLANQTIVAVNIAAVAEALTLAIKAGVDPSLVVGAISGGLAGSTVLNAKAPMMIEGNFKPGFKIDLHIKDLKNVMTAAEAYNSPTPLTERMLKILEELSADGMGGDDHSGIYKYYEKISQ